MLSRMPGDIQIGDRFQQAKEILNQMAKATKIHDRQNGPARYEKALRDLQIELVKVQKHVIEHGHKVLVIFEGA